MAIGRGRVNTVDDSQPIQYVQLSYSKIETKDNIPRVMEYGYTSNPPAKTDAVAVHVTGDRSNAICIGTNHQPSRPTSLATGEVTLYQLNGIQVYLSNAGLNIVAASLPVVVSGATTVTINAATKVRMVTPRLECTGDIVDNCDTTGRSMADDRVIYDSHDHDIHNVQSGSSTVTSNSPNQPQ
ncbi:phage baseplate assembly protein [Paraburkholderia aspalathi]|nr:phage baseplate assembly protein [Paraburkholderia aspalathi]